MTLTAKVTALIVGAVLVACIVSCQRNGASTTAKDGSNKTIAAATLTAVPTTSAGAPRRADGYWEMASVGASGTPLDKQYLCVGNNSEEKYSLFDQLSELGTCSKKQFVRTASGWDFETQCAMMGTVTTQKGKITGDFKTRFRVDQTVAQSNGAGIKGSVLGRRVGNCPAQFGPGDLVDADGQKLSNVIQSSPASP
jgi:Protein of unknown function (DUF3617)